MSASPYYDRPVLLDREKHRAVRVRTSSSYAFARRTNSLYVAGVEFPEAVKEYPIVFTRAAGKVSPVVMLGLRPRENLFVDDAEKWTASYVPAFVRRYPFVLAQLGQDNMGVCIDEGYAGLNEAEGEALFDAYGNNTPFLNNAVEFLTRYQKEFVRTEQFCRRIDEAGLLVEMNARADIKDGRSFTVSGLLVVDEKKLQALPDDKALAFFRSGELHLISLHLASLSNMHKLVARLASHPEPLQPAPKPPG